MSSVSPSFVICLVMTDFWAPLLFFNFSSSSIVSITAPKFRYVICEMRIDLRCVSTQCLLYPPQTLFVGGILFSRCPSVRVSVRPSVRNALFP